ncbi:unnamed protein product [Prunus armeniaca]|uniref:Zinc knuckle CX2CX4HX4C domain-containing protein n=1 Tax=Prunus armeniaca TaxID=36596 RepID=A0A6J5U187_PRUAR|nr:unnamed protein product [Prunus armeniaca]CAB4298711.1 unnamed protein product [Prunus armeniaca]
MSYYPAAMSLPIRDQDVVNDDIERSFGSCLVLTPREHAGVVIGSSTVSDSFIGFTYSLVANALDKKRVLNMEPWPYQCSLIFLAKIPDDDSMHSMPLMYGNFWDNRDGTSCVSCFIRIRVLFDVTLPLIRWKPITYPEVREKLVEFKYDYLPEYCFACERIGHPSQVVPVILHAMRVSGTKMDRGIRVVLIIDLGDLVPEARMSFRILSPLQPYHVITKC